MSYIDNFFSGIRILQSQRPELNSLKALAEYLGMGYQAFAKVMDGTNRPTTELCIKLCKSAGLNANWMFLSKGEIMYQDDRDIKQLIKELAVIKSTVLSLPGATKTATNNVKTKRKIKT